MTTAMPPRTRNGAYVLTWAIPFLLAGPLFGGETGVLVNAANMAELHCAMPTPEVRLLGSSAPQQLFYPKEAVTLRLAFKKSAEAAADGAALEIQEIGTRTPGKVSRTMEGFSDTVGHAPIVDLIGKPLNHPIKIALTEQPETIVEIQNAPVPERFGTYALVLVRGDKRQFLGTVCRVVLPREDANLESTPIFGEGTMFDDTRFYEQRAAANERMGVHGLRLETGWAERQDGTYDWSRLDLFFGAVSRHRIQLMVTLGGHAGWQWPWGIQTPAAVAPNWDGNPYGGQSDWVCDPKLYPRYGKWITAFCERYWKNGQGGLWGLENYNEPWEGGGISGWARDCLEYRKIQKLIAESAWKVDRKIRICAASSVMNTEDKLFPDGSKEFEQYIDVFTDHYLVPSACYGPLAARARGKQSVETETWFVGTECMLPQVAQFLAAGQGRLSPWHPRALFDALPGVADRYLIPTPLCAATAAFNRFVSGKSFEKMPFREHLPFVFQFGKDTERDAVLVVFGKLMVIGGGTAKEQIWAQVNETEGGTLTIDNRDRLLRFYDLAGNPQYEDEASVTLPMTIFPAYITCEKGPAAAVARLKEARIEGKRPVEILPRDFNTPLNDPQAALRVGLHNCLNRAISGKLAVTAPAEIKLRSSQQSVELAAGETRTLAFAVAAAQLQASNAYAFKFLFSSDAGGAQLDELMNVAIAPRRTIAVDGNLDDWKDIPGVTVVAGKQQADLPELLRRPWLEMKELLPDGGCMQFKLAWDEQNLYVCALVHDKAPVIGGPPMEGRDENRYFHCAASDQREPFKSWLVKNGKGHSFAEVPYVYADSPESPRQMDLPAIPFRRDRLQIAFDVADDWHDFAPTTGKVPYGFHAVPDSDYEYSLYLCSNGKSECWRHLAPGVPRLHDFPRQPRGNPTTGPVQGARHVVKLDGNTWTYELAIPKEELATLKLQAGTSFGLMVRAGNNKGPHVDYAAEKAVTKSNGLTLHPYWERSSNCGVRWTLVEK